MNLAEFEAMQRDIVLNVARVRHLENLHENLVAFQGEIYKARVANIGNGLGSWSIKNDDFRFDEKLVEFEEQVEMCADTVEFELSKAKKDADECYRIMQRAIFCPDAE